jgi:aspartate-semialdehyde dehydrogenase
MIRSSSARSAGKVLDYRGTEVVVEDAETADPTGLDIALFSAGATASRTLVPRFVEAGVIVVDNSSAFRKDPDVPLIVPEVNPDAVKDAKKKNIIANPNCSTAQLVVALKPLHDAAKIKRVVVSTYQSVSGAGKEGMDELWNQTKAIYGLGDATPKKFPKQIAFNVIPFIGSFNEDGYTDEEQKMWDETHKMLDPNIKLTVTCVRVPVFVGHSESVTVEFDRPIEPDEARAILREAPGVLVVDKQEHDGYITPVDAAGEFAVYVSRIRKDPTVENGLSFWVVSDNLRKGAALNAVQIAQLLDETGTIKPSSGYRSITV